MQPSTFRRGAQLLLETAVRKAAIEHYLAFNTEPADRMGHPTSKLDFSRSLRIPRRCWLKWVRDYRAALAAGQPLDEVVHPKPDEPWITERV